MVGQAFSSLAPAEVIRIVEAIRKRYTHHDNLHAYLWEDFENSVSIRNSAGWEIACDYPVEEPLLIFQEGSKFSAFRFANQDAVRQVLAESPGFEFFLTDDECSFVMCFNHHDYLIGVGACRNWLSQLPDCPGT